MVSIRRSTAVLCAYVTVDEVNQDLAERLAARAGMRLEIVFPRDAAEAASSAMVLYDLDSLPPADRQALLAGLSLQPAGSGGAVVAVHSYYLPPRQARALRRQGVLVARRLRPTMFDRLRAAAGGKKAPGRRRRGTGVQGVLRAPGSSDDGPHPERPGRGASPA
jgi:hypothetical protein